MASAIRPKRNRNVLTIETKLKILNRLEKGESGSLLASEFNVGKSTISDIKRNRENILQFASKLDSEDGSKKRKTMREANDSSLEQAVHMWFVQRHSKGEPISGPLLCEKALELNKKLGGSSDFKASTGWLKNFKSRHGIRELQIEGESLSGDVEAASEMKQKFLDVVKNEGYSRDDVYNADETGLNWKSLPRKSLASKRELAAPGFKVSKERVTVMVCANASRTHRLPLLVIGKSKKPRCFKNVACIPTVYKAQKSAWMNSELFSEWYAKEFVPTVKRYREREGKSGNVLLLLDNAPCHPATEILNAVEENFKVVYFPPNITALIQPMDQGVIEKLKRIYKKQVLRRLLLADNDEESVVAFSKKLNLKDCCYMLAESWELMTVDNLKNAWNKLWSIEETDKNDSEEQQLQQQQTNEITNLIQSIAGFQECDKEDANEWLESDTDPGFQILNEDEVITCVQEKYNSTEIETDEDEDDCDKNKGPSHAEAFVALETAMMWYERQHECCSTQLLLLKRLKRSRR